MSTFGKGARTMSVKPQSITDLAEVWDELTPVQQQFMIQRAKGLVGMNKMRAAGVWPGDKILPAEFGSDRTDKLTKQES